MLTNGTFYQDLGPDHFNKLDKQRHTKGLVNRLKDLGYYVQLTPLPTGA